MKGERKWVDSYVTHFFYIMQSEETLERIKQELIPILEEFKAEAIELTLKRFGNKLILRFLVDKKDGITMDECASINRRLGDLIEEKSIINERYLLEVSSPGLDRPLKAKRDFERVRGKDIEIWLSVPIESRSYIRAVIKSADEQSVLIEDKEAKEISVPYQSIAKARLKFA